MRTAFRISVAVALIAVSIGLPWLLHHQAQVELRAMRDTWDQQASRLSLLAQENRRLSNLVAHANASSSLTAEQLKELLRLRNEKHWLTEQTNRATQLLAGASVRIQLSPAELKAALRAEMIEAMKRILPEFQPAWQKYALAHLNQPPDGFSTLQDFFPLVAGRKMAGLRTFEFVRAGGPSPGDTLFLRGSPESRPGDGGEVRIYGFSDGRVVQVTSEDGRFDDWEAQHLNSAVTGTEDQVFLEAAGTTQERAHVTELAASIGISAEDAGRFFDRIKQQQRGLGQRLEEMRNSLTGSAEEKQREMQAAVAEELNKLAIETLGDKGPALVQELTQPK